MSSRFLAGLDLGQAADYTALIIAEQTLYDDARASYDVRHIQRWTLGTPYPQIVAEVVALFARPQLPADVQLIVDGGGVGRAVVNLFQAESTLAYRMVPISITAGATVNLQEEPMTSSPPTADVRRVHPESKLGRLQATQAAMQAALERNATMTGGLERTIGELDAWLEAVTIETDLAMFTEKRARRELLATVLKRTRAERSPLEQQQQAVNTEHQPIYDTWLKVCREHEQLADMTNPYTRMQTVAYLQTKPAEIESWLQMWAWEPAQPTQEVTS